MWDIPSSASNICSNISGELSDWTIHRNLSLSLATPPHGVRFVSESDIRRALDVAPLVALFAYATGNDLWTNPQKLEAPRTAGYLRSLTRRMQREARVFVERSVPCPS